MTQHCFQQARDAIVAFLNQHVPGVEIRWVCFENNLEKANAKAMTRLDRDPLGHVGQNNRVSPLYTIPDGAEVIAIWD